MSKNEITKIKNAGMKTELMNRIRSELQSAEKRLDSMRQISVLNNLTLFDRELMEVNKFVANATQLRDELNQVQVLEEAPIKG